jgi:hypothetical protein
MICKVASPLTAVRPSLTTIHDPNVAVGLTAGFLTNGTLEEKVRGRTAAWADGRLLMWKEDGISFVVGGLKLSLDEAKRIAESLR